MTYGDLRFRLAKLLPPETDPDVLDGWIGDRYTTILDRLSWQRAEVATVITTVAQYIAGTVAATNGSTTVTGTGTTWTAAMSGRAFRLVADGVWYTFTYISATSGTLDRAYAGETATEAGYTICRQVYALPADCKIVPDGGLISSFTGPLQRSSKTALRASDPTFGTGGYPQFFAAYMDSSNIMQVLLSPWPDTVQTLRINYIAETAAPTATGTTLIPWMRPAALISGVLADSALAAKELGLADIHQKAFEAHVAEMIRTEAANTPNGYVGMADRFTRHRRARWNR